MKSSLMGLRNLVRRRQEAGDVPAELQGDPMAVAKTLRRLVQQDTPDPAVTEIWKTYFTNLGSLARIAANTTGCDLIVISGGAQEREDGVSDSAFQRYLDNAILWIGKTSRRVSPT
jgi:glucokinase